MGKPLVVTGLLSTLAVVGIAAADQGSNPPFTAPPVSTPDTTLPRPDGVDVIGTTDKLALLKLTSWAPRASYYGVLDLRTGCVVETYPGFARVERLLHGKGGTPAQTQALADRATQDEIRQYLGLRSRFGSRKDTESIYAGNFAWSGDGSKIVVTLDGAFYRSRDGGQSYEQLDTNMAYKPFVTSDGRFAFFQRCGSPGRTHACTDAQKEVGIVDLESASKPRIVTVGQGMIEGLDPTGNKLLVVRDDEPRKVVATHLDPATGTFRRAFAIAAPPLEPNTFFTIDPSRGGRYGMFHHWISKRGDPAIMASVAVIDMSDGRIVHKQRQPFVGTEVDDEGRLAWGTVNLVRTYATTPRGIIRNAGPGDRVGWAPGGRLIVFEPPATTAGNLGDVMCRLVRIKPIAG